MTPRDTSSIVQVDDVQAGSAAVIEARYIVGDEALSGIALTVLNAALAHRTGEVPTTQGLYEVMRDQAQRRGHPYLGIDSVKLALKELKDRGFYGVRRFSGGRRQIVQVRSFSNLPHEHLKTLEALDRDQVLAYHFPQQ